MKRTFKQKSLSLIWKRF